MKTILLLGEHRFLGSHVCRTLIQIGNWVLIQHSTTPPHFKNLAVLKPNLQLTPFICKSDCGSFGQWSNSMANKNNQAKNITSLGHLNSRLKYKSQVMVYYKKDLQAVIIYPTKLIAEQYIISGNKIQTGDFRRSIKTLNNKKTPRIMLQKKLMISSIKLPGNMSCIFKCPKPIISLIGNEIIKYGSCEKAKRDLGYTPKDTWLAVSRGYHWYKAKSILK